MAYMFFFQMKGTKFRKKLLRNG